MTTPATTQPSDVTFAVERGRGEDADLQTIHGLTSADIIAAAAAVKNGTIVTSTALADFGTQLAALQANTVTPEQLLAALNSLTQTPPTQGVVPGAVTNLTSSAAASAVTLLFTPPPGALTLNVFRSFNSGTAIQIDGGNLTGAATTFVDPGLSAGAYTYTMSATNAAGTGPISSSTTITIAAPAKPAAPTSFVGQPNGTMPILSWVAPAGPLLGYQLSYTFNGGASTPITPGPGPNAVGYAVLSAQAAGTYVYTIAAVNAQGAGTTATCTVVVVSAVGDIDYVDHGAADFADASDSTLIFNGTTFAPTAGQEILAFVVDYSTDPNISGSLTDTFSDGAGKTSWGAPKVSRVSAAAGDFHYLACFSRIAGTNPATTVASGSNSVNTSTFVGAGTLNVASTTGLPASGSITVATGTTPAVINYTGKTGSTFTGCTTASGGGVMSTGGAVACAGQVVFTRQSTGGSVTVPSDRAGRIHSLEIVNGASDVPAQPGTGNDSLVSTLVVTLGQTPATDGILFSLAVSRTFNATLTIPTDGGTWTALDNSGISGKEMTVALAVRKKPGGSQPKTQSWAGLDTNINGAISIEFAHASSPAAPPTGVPAAVTGLAVSKAIQSNGSAIDTLTWTSDPNCSGVNIYEGAIGFTPDTTNLTNSIGSPTGVGIATFLDTTPRAAGASYDYYVEPFNVVGRGALTKITVVVPAVSSSSLQTRFGGTVQAMTSGSGNDQFVVSFMDATHVNAPNWQFYTCWPTNDGTGHSSGSTHNAMVDAATFYSTSGRSLTTKTACFTMHPACTDGPSGTWAAILNGTFDAVINSFGAHLATYFAATGKRPRVRIGHEPNNSFVWGFVNTVASMTAYNTGFHYVANLLKIACPQVMIEFSGYDAEYDFTTAIQGALTAICDIMGFDLYDDGQLSPGNNKTSQTDPYATYTDANAAWNMRYYRNSDPANPVAGSNAWVAKWARTNNKPLAISELGLVARINFPTAGGGDNPGFINHSADLIAASLSDLPVDHVNYFNNDVTSIQQYHEPFINPFVVARGALITRFSA